jgi:hypothetical protein
MFTFVEGFTTQPSTDIPACSWLSHSPPTLGFKRQRVGPESVLNPPSQGRWAC